MSAEPLGEAPRLLHLLDELLLDQRSVSAVDVFARRHDEGAVPATGRIYEDRIPVGRTPGPGQQLAFRVDLDACTGCKACVTACHSLNGLAPEETWRDVGLLLGEEEGSGFQQTVTTACHHCEDPACLSGCPVQAYEKDPTTGIVRHLDDQCIGCQYCILKCPYDVPRYHADLGIVRKCDMCVGRLDEGETPACVQGCPNGAIAIDIVDQVGPGGAPELLPGATGAIPDSATTRPTTRYVSRKPVRALRPADRDRLVPSPSHDPLAVMLVLMQLSVGALGFEALASAAGLASGAARAWSHALAAACAVSGLAAATLHLGRPLLAYRAFLGWRTSWMSREILAFGAYAPAVVLTAAASMLVLLGARVPPWAAQAAEVVLWVLRAVALAAGAAGTACSVMIYADTRRPGWALSRTAPTFGGTLVGLGALGAAAVFGLAAWGTGGRGTGVAGGLVLVGSGVLAAKCAAEARLLALARDDASDALARTARLLRGPLERRVKLRFGLAAGGLLAAMAALCFALGGATAGAAACALCALAGFALGELVERHLYFTAEASPGMPGV